MCSTCETCVNICTATVPFHHIHACTLYTTNACGKCPLCLYSHEPCCFSTYLYVVAVTHVTPRDLLYGLRKVTSGIKRKHSCSSSLLLSNAPHSDRRYTYSEEQSAIRSRIITRNAAIVAITEHASAVHTPCCDDLWGNVTRLSLVRSPFVRAVRKTPCGMLFEEILPH